MATLENPIRDAALRYLRDGYSVVPIREREKRPAIEWEKFQRRIPTEAEVNQWFSDGHSQIAIVCGRVSGGLIVFDFDGDGWKELFETFKKTFPDLLESKYVITGSGKLHIYVRCKELPDDVTRKVRRFPGKGEIELRGNEHYVLCPPSVHPSGGIYRFKGETIIDISKERLNEIILWFNDGKRQTPPPRKDEETEISDLTANQQRALARFYLRRLIRQCRRGAGRNAKGYELARRLLDAGLSQEEAVPFIEEFHREVPPGDHFYKLDEAIDSLKSAYRNPRQAPWIPEGFFRINLRTGELLDEEAVSDEMAGKLLNYPLTDAGNGESFVELYGNQFCFVKEKGKWFKWDGVRWREEDEEARLSMLQTARTRNRVGLSIENADIRKKYQNWANLSESHYRVEAALKFGEAMLNRNFIDFDTDPYLLCCENGVVNLKTGEFQQATHSDWLHKSNGVTYDREARCPRWIQFLDEIFQGDSGLIHFIKKAVGYTLTGDVSEQCLFICHGSGANGKSVLLGILGDLLGEYGQSTPSSTFKEMRNEGNNATPELARMAGARLVKSVEVKERVRLNIERIKALTGGDKIVARFLFQDVFEFSPRFKIWIALNHKPIVSDTSEAIWRRIRLIPFNAYFPPGVRNTHLADTLKGELNGILNWAIEGCLQWQRDGLQPPEPVSKATNEYRQENDVVGRFLEEGTAQETGSEVQSSILYRMFQSWCEIQGEHSTPQKEFSQEMERKGYQKRKRGVHYWEGLTILR